MKNTFFIIAILFLFNCCKKDSIEMTTDLNDDEVADLIAASLQTSTSGLSADIDNIAIWLETGSGKTATTAEWTCDYAGDSTIVKSGNLLNTTYDYSADYTYAAVCDGVVDLPTALGVTCSIDGTYENSRIESDDNASGVFNITELLNPNSDYMLDGTLVRNGSQTHKVRNIGFASGCTINMTDIAVDKTTYIINGGSATVNLTAQNGTEQKTYTASVNFSGEGTAVITIGTQTYNINLNQ